MFRFKCASCDEWHEGMPTFGANAPLHFYGIEAEDRSRRCVLDSDTCIIDHEFSFLSAAVSTSLSMVRPKRLPGEFGSRSARTTSLSSRLTTIRRSGRISAPSSVGSQPNCRFIQARRISRPACISETTVSAHISSLSPRTILSRLSREMGSQLIE